MKRLIFHRNGLFGERKGAVACYADSTENRTVTFGGILSWQITYTIAYCGSVVKLELSW